VEQSAGGYGSLICLVSLSHDPTFSTILKHPALERQKRFISSNKRGRKLYAEDNKAMPRITGRKRMVNVHVHRMRECQSPVDLRVSTISVCSPLPSMSESYR